MKTKINYAGAVFWGFVITAFGMYLGNYLYTNPVVSRILTRYEGIPVMGSGGFFSAQGSPFLPQVIFGLIFSAVIIGLYLMLYESIPGTGWKKGLAFGLMIGVVKAVPEAFYQWAIYKSPAILIETHLANSFISLVVFCVLLSAAFERFKVIMREEKQWLKKVRA
jgi:hypothetical protein